MHVISARPYPERDMDLNLEEYELNPTNQEESVQQDVGDFTQVDRSLGVPDVGAEPAPISVRKPIPKLDASRLLNKHRGYPVLLDRLKNIKYKGKGRERQYLERYMVTYQLWSNRLWPKAKLDDFILMARNTSRDPQIRRYCRDLIDKEKDERMFPRMSRSGNAGTGNRGEDRSDNRSEDRNQDTTEERSEDRSEDRDQTTNDNTNSGTNSVTDPAANPEGSADRTDADANDNPIDDIPPDDELDALQNDSEAERVQAEMEHELYGDFDF